MIQDHRLRFLVLLGVLSGLPALGSRQAVAEDKLCPCPPETPPPPLWTGSVGLSFVSASGNSDYQTLGFTAGFARKPTPWGAEITALANRAETDGVKTAEKWLAGVRGTRALSERLEWFGGLSYEHDEFAGFDSRTVIETGALWRALSGPRHELAFDGGLTYTSEDPVLGERADSFGAVAGFNYAWKLTASATLRERFLAYPNFEHSDDWRLRSETTFEAAFAASWALRVGYLCDYDNLPPVGFEKSDGTASVSLVWKR